MLNRPTIATAIFLATAPLATTVQAGSGVTTLSEGVLKVCMFIDIPPLAKQIDGDDWIGWDVSFLSGFAESLNLAFEPVALTVFPGLWNKPGESVCDIAGGGITDTEERRAQTLDGAWSDNYFATQRSFIVREGEQDRLNDVNDLANRTVVVWPGSAGAADLQRRIDQQGVPQVTIEHTDGVMPALERVRDGNAFAFGWDIASTRYQVGLFPGLAVTWAHPMLLADGSEANEEYAYIVREADTALLKALNAYIADNRHNFGWPR